MRAAAVSVALLSLCFSQSAAFAADFLQRPYVLAQDFDISEVRGGPAFSNLEMKNGGTTPNLESFNKARLDSLQLDILFGSPNLDLFRWIGSPRPSIGTVINLGGYESLIHAGLDWHLPVFNTPFYLEAGVGAGVHNGYLDGAPAGFHDLGCRVLLHYKYGAGVNLTSNVTLTAQWQHMSNVVFGCQPNAGVNDGGVVLGWKF